MGIIPDIFNERIEGPDGSHMDVMMPHDEENNEESNKKMLKRRKLLRDKYNQRRKKSRYEE